MKAERKEIEKVKIFLLKYIENVSHFERRRRGIFFYLQINFAGSV